MWIILNNIFFSSLGYTPIQRAVKRGYSDLLNVVKILAPISKNPNAKDPEGWTPIARAATNCQLEFVKALVPYCDNPNAVSFDGFTPLQRFVTLDFFNSWQLTKYDFLKILKSLNYSFVLEYIGLKIKKRPPKGTKELFKIF